MSILLQLSKQECPWIISSNCVVQPTILCISFAKVLTNPPCPLFVLIMMNCALPSSHGELRHMEGVDDDIERFSLVARVDGNKPVWGVALWQGRAAEDLRQSPARADGKIRQRLTLQMKPLDRFILTTRSVFLHFLPSDTLSSFWSDSAVIGVRRLV